MKRYLVEFIGTFFFLLAIICISASTRYDAALHPLAIGLILSGIIYASGHISGAHLNPGVSVAMFLRKRLSSKDLPGYILAQFLAAILAAVLGVFLFKTGTWLGKSSGTFGSPLVTFVCEALGTLLLVWVILNVATAKGTKGNSFYGLAIGFTVVGLIYAFDGLAEVAYFNPAVVLKDVLTGNLAWRNAGVLVIANIFGAFLGYGAYALTDKQ